MSLNKKKIGLFLGTTHDMGGTFQYVQTLLTALTNLPKDTYEAVAVYTSTEWVNPTRELGIRSIQVPAHGSFMLAARLWRFLRLPVKIWRKASFHFHPLTRLMCREECDLWIYPGQNDIWSYMLPLPSLVAIHDLMHRYERQFPEASARGRYYLREWDCRNMCQWTKGILVDSKIGQQHIVESYGHDPAKIHVLPYIAPPQVIQTSDLNAIYARHELPSKFLFYPAKFWKHKNHQNLILAMSQLKQRLPDLQFVFTGIKAWNYPAIQKLIQELGLTDRILILDYLPDRDLQALYLKARALIMPTYFGPTNIPPLEAFAAGCPVAISNVYAMPDQVGDAALLFDPSSVNEIAECIFRLWTDDQLCLELIRRGHQRTAAWNINTFSRAFQNILSEVLSSPANDR